MLELSKYVYAFERNGRYFLYAPLSNSFAELDNNVYERIVGAQKGSVSLENLDVDTI